MAETSTTIQPVNQLQVPTSVKSLIEGLIFGAREPLTVRQIQGLYEDQGTEGNEPRKISYEDIGRLVEELNSDYVASDRPYRIIQIAGGYQFATQPAYAEWLGKLYKEQTRRKLSQSSVETLAIIAYKQPITKPELEAIRGVNCDYVLSTLLEKDLATIVGRAATVGRPLLYGTSKEFLRHFGLNDLNDLPKPREIQEILGESQFETERRMLEAQQGLDEPKKEEEFKSRLPHIPKRKAGLDDDVKILPKKRTREIKVRPADEIESAQPEAIKEEQTVTDVPVMVSATEPQDQTPEALELESADNVLVPSTEDVLTVDDQLVQSGPGEIEAVLSAEQSKYLNLTQVDVAQTAQSPEAIDEIEKSEPAPETVLEATQAATESAYEDVAEPPLEQMPVVVDEVSVGSPVVAAELSSVAEDAGVEEIPTPAIESVDLVESVQDTSVLTPQAVSPSVEELTEVVGHAEPDVAHAEEPDTNSSSQPKPRWKTWKEKIQGFIKKLFG